MGKIENYTLVNGIYIDLTKSIPARKAELTKDIKHQKEHIEELEKAYNEGKRKGKIFGWYLGNQIFRQTVWEAKRDLERTTQLREELNKPEQKEKPAPRAEEAAASYQLTIF
jgi:hypothetical protein